jgi:NIMA (never in mitosis gene a)-related kinase 1/4/5
MSLGDFEILSKLGINYLFINLYNSGTGAYSSVYKVKRIADAQEYAMKKVDINDLTFKEKQNALNEVRILASLKHQNVISYKEAFFDEPSGMLW